MAELKNGNGKNGAGVEPYGNFSGYGYSVLQHSFQKWMAVQPFDCPYDRLLLNYMYGAKENVWGMLDAISEQFARRIGADFGVFTEHMKSLQKQGYIYQDGQMILLLDWRRAMGIDKASRNEAGELRITKGMANAIKANWESMLPEGRRMYLDSCGLTNYEQIITIINEQDPYGRGGDRKSDSFKNQSKINLKSTLDQSSINQKSNNKNNNNRNNEKEQENEGGRISENPPPSFSKNRTTEEMIRLLQDALFQEFRANPWDKQSSKWKGLHELCLLALGRVYNPDLSPVWKDRDFMLYAKELKGRLGVYGEETGLPPPYWLGNLCSPGFIDWLAKDDDAVMLFQRINDLKRSMPEYDGCSEPAQSAPPRRRAVPPDIGSSIDDLPEYVPQEDCPYEPNDGTPVIRVPDRSCSDHDPREDADSDAY